MLRRSRFFEIMTLMKKASVTYVKVYDGYSDKKKSPKKMELVEIVDPKSNNIKIVGRPKERPNEWYSIYKHDDESLRYYPETRDIGSLVDSSRAISPGYRYIVINNARLKESQLLISIEGQEAADSIPEKVIVSAYFGKDRKIDFSKKINCLSYENPTEEVDIMGMDVGSLIECCTSKRLYEKEINDSIENLSAEAAKNSGVEIYLDLSDGKFRACAMSQRG